ncbi:hypothetical protein [Aureliella helgolandensis]|uniref:hypothetical protein n=1 Tax=Aureliella helgolandensis TaxID=2527968 RepID=UPI0011A58EA2|nr:hypothetical protein [Aureliella helgolandensis]
MPLSLEREEEGVGGGVLTPLFAAAAKFASAGDAIEKMAGCKVDCRHQLMPQSHTATWKLAIQWDKSGLL